MMSTAYMLILLLIILGLQIQKLNLTEVGPSLTSIKWQCQETNIDSLTPELP